MQRSAIIHTALRHFLWLMFAGAMAAAQAASSLLNEERKKWRQVVLENSITVQ